MARGPFQGTHVSGIRPTIVTSPDAMVYINGNAEVVGCSQCKKRFPFNKYITSIQVDLSVESVPGSASISMSIPRHAVDDFYFDQVPIVSPMMEIEIYAKGYFLVEGLPQYYPIFWGLITEVSDSYSGGEHTVTIHCADILKWWEVTKMAINSAYTSASPGAGGMSLFGNVFFGMNPYDIIWTLAQQSFGDVVVGTGSLVNFTKEGTQRQTFSAALTDIMSYWESRFRRIRSNLLLYGVNGVAVRGDSLWEATPKGKNNTVFAKGFASKAVSYANGGADAGQMVFDPTNPNVVAYRSNLNANVPLWQSEYQPKLEIATAAKEAIGFELYMDVDGSIVFKPPFFNLDILSNKPVSWIQDIDVIDWDFSESEAEVVTQLQLQGSFAGNLDLGLSEEVTPLTTVTDYHLLRQYGWRTQTYNSEFMGDPKTMFYHGLDILDRLNSRRHRGSVSIPLRPELRLGFPIYVAPKDQVWYVTGISHNIQFGGRAQTTLTLTGRRKKWVAPVGTGVLKLKGFKGKVPPTNPGKTKIQYTSRQLSAAGQFEMTIADAATVPPVNPPQPGQSSPYDALILRHPKTGRLVGFPNAVMVYSRPFAPAPDVREEAAGQKTVGEKNPAVRKGSEAKYKNTLEVYNQGAAKQTTFGTYQKLREKYVTNRYSYGLSSAGVYYYARDVGTGKAGVIQEFVLVPAQNLKITATAGTVDAPKNASGMIRPVSDERGFEVIGHFRYGRGVSLRDGRLVLQDGTTNDAATVSTQAALSGDMFAMLTAQSQGLTSITSQYPNPAAVLASLTPEDRQTAGFVNPETGQPEFQTTEDNFVSTAPLGSPEQAGADASVEATQLSRALTLAEMSVTTDDVTNDKDCACVLGRADLTFMNFGYNVKVINTTSPDNSNLSGSGLFQDATSTTRTDGSAPMFDPSTQGTTDFISKVDQFLFNLYSALDAPHQAYEEGLRGQNLQTDPNSPEDIRFGTTQETVGDLTPPFSPGNRAALGDPRAIAQQADSALTTLGNDWKNFGSDLKNAAVKAKLQGEIAKEQSDLARLQAQKAQLLANPASKAEQDVAQALGYKNPAEALADLDKQIAGVEQQIANDQHRLSTLG